MDLWSVHVKSTTGIAFPVGNCSSEKAISWNSGKLVSYRAEDCGFVEIKVRGKASADQSFVLRALGKKNNNNDSSNSSSFPGNGDYSVPEGDGLEKNIFSSENSKSKANGPQKPHQKPLDWREFRAVLFEREQALTQQEGPTKEAEPLGLKWAHPLSSPELGCVLVATEKLDGSTFERSVILLLRSGTRHPRDGPFGIIINRPLYKKMKHRKPSNQDLATIFAECSVHFGGSLDGNVFLLRSAAQNHPSRPAFVQVVPGLCFGYLENLDEAAWMVKKGFLKPHDFRFFNGYAGWHFDQLRDEIESELWHVAACSPNLFLNGLQNENLWEEILQLMGGRYSDLSRKPKEDS